MKRILQIAMLVTCTAAFASLAQAQATRTWVSGVGDDANPCSRTAPCKTFAGAISKTAACGEIDALDPGGFGAVTITKAITIDGTGTMASILASLTNGVIINATGDANAIVTLRGISINGACNGLDGVRILSAKGVNIEDCVIFKLTNGIVVNETNDVFLNVKNTVVRDNITDGVNLFTSSGTVKATFDNSRISGSGVHGLHARGGSRVTANHCVVANNSGNGVFVDGATAGSISHVRVWNSQISVNGGHGVAAGNTGNLGTSIAEIGQNLIDNNGANGVIVLAGGTAETFTNNSIRGNATNGCPGCTGVGPGN